MTARAVDRPVEARRGSMALSIKRLTAPAHRQAEAVVQRAAPLSSHRAYVAYLTRLHAFYAAVEPRLFELLGDFLPDASERRKLDLIERDLAALGGLVPSGPAMHAPSLPRLTCTASAMGVAYVLEGKTLGSRFLLEDARRLLDLDAGRGASFFAGYEARTGAMWRVYRDELESFVAQNGRRATVLAGATSTFASFIRWVAPLGDGRETRHGTDATVRCEP